MYSLKQDFKKKFFFTLRTTVPIVILTILLAFVIFLENNSFGYKISIFFLGIIASTYYIYYMFFSDVREKIIDEITGAFNRKYILSHFNRYKNHWILLFSIDNIKEINERYGIENGDKVLRKFALYLDFFFQDKLHKEVPIARIKSGDFLVVLPKELTEEEVREFSEDFLRLYDNNFIDNIEIKLIAASDRYEGEKVKKLLDRLYEELYYCKEKCKTKKVEQKRRTNKINDFEETIVKLIKENRLSLNFQPAFHLKKNRFDLVEVIVRFFDSEGNIIHPSEFVPVINRLGLENDFDLAVTKKLLEAIQTNNFPTDLHYSFRLSPFSVRNKRFQKRFFELFEDCSVPRECFVIELYEAGIYKDLKFYRSILSDYKQEGFLLAFDHFGTCNASIEYIKEFDVDFVIFDRSFTKNIDKERYRVLLRSWVEAFRVLGLKSVVKFIDSSQKIEDFVEIGVDYIEGFAVARPMDSKSLLKFLKEDHAIR